MTCPVRTCQSETVGFNLYDVLVPGPVTHLIVVLWSRTFPEVQCVRTRVVGDLSRRRTCIPREFYERAPSELTTLRLCGVLSTEVERKVSPQAHKPLQCRRSPSCRQRKG